MRPRSHYCIREVLIQAGFSVSDVAKLTSHSLKATLLSWVAKAGCSTQIRRALGGHTKASDRTPDIYTRARMAEPIRVLEEVLAWVRHGALDPDMGRLGRWTVHPSKVKEDALSRLTQEITELKETDPEGRPRGSAGTWDRRGPAGRCVVRPVVLRGRVLTERVS